LEPQKAQRLVKHLVIHGASTVWIGKCNQLRKRTAWRRAQLVEEAKAEALRGKGASAGQRLRCFDEMLAELEAGQTDTAVLDVVASLKENPHVRWKDSYRKVIERNGGK
jgi:hypothetical protein